MNNLLTIPRQDWPWLIAVFAEVIGEDGAVMMFTRFKGRHLRVPKQATPGGPIEETIGQEKASELCRVFGNETLIIPNGTAEFVRARNRQVHADWHAGMKQCDIASKYGVTERTINKIINHWSYK